MSGAKKIRSAAKKELTALKIKWVLEVTANQKCLHRLAPAVVNMMAFKWHDERVGYAYPGIDRIAETLGAGRTGVKQAIASLEHHGHLIVQRRGYKPSHYRWKIKGDVESCDAVIEGDCAVVGRKPGLHEVAHEDEIVQGDVSRKPDPHEGAGEDRKKTMWGGNPTPMWGGNPTPMWGGNPTTNPISDPYQVGGSALRRDPPSLRSASTGAPTSDVVRDNSTGGAKEEERARLEGARSPSVTGKEETPTVAPVPTSAPKKKCPHPQTPSPDHACFEDFMAAYPKCWVGADDPNSGEFIDEWIEAEDEWCRCEMDGEDMDEAVRGAQEFAWHVTVQVERNGDAVNSWSPREFLEDELWKHPKRWTRTGART